jgi:cyanuric acid amidohydrolase
MNCDEIDLPAVIGALTDAELPPVGQLTDAQRGNLLGRAGQGRSRYDGKHSRRPPHHAGRQRHQCHQARLGGVIAGIVGRTDLFVSGGAEHQGSDGGGPVAVIVARSALQS